jgi:hypothetical protein
VLLLLTHDDAIPPTLEAHVEAPSPTAHRALFALRITYLDVASAADDALTK